MFSPIAWYQALLLKGSGVNPFDLQVAEDDV